MGWDGGINYIQEDFRKVVARCFFMEYFSSESCFAVAIVSGKLIGTSPTLFIQLRSIPESVPTTPARRDIGSSYANMIAYAYHDGSCANI